MWQVRAIVCKGQGMIYHLGLPGMLQLCALLAFLSPQLGLVPGPCADGQGLMQLGDTFGALLALLGCVEMWCFRTLLSLQRLTPLQSASSLLGVDPCSVPRLRGEAVLKSASSIPRIRSSAERNAGEMGLRKTHFKQD